MAITQAALPHEELTASKPYSYRVLAVDDDKNCAKVMAWLLESLGHTAQIAHDGKTAIELANSVHPDMVLMDIGIPEMNGYQICQAMRDSPGLDHTLFVALTGWGQKEHRERSKEAGFDYHLVKPVNIEALKKIFSELDKVRIQQT